MDLLKLMAPIKPSMPVDRSTFSTPPVSFAGSLPERREFGAAATTAAAITATVASLTDAALKVAPVVMKSIKADQALAKKEMIQYKKLKNKLARVKDKELAKGIRSSMLSSLERAEMYKLRAMISAGGKIPQGPRLEGTAMEIRRNVLANEWEAATDPAERSRIEALIVDYDRQLMTLEYASKATLSEEIRVLDDSRRSATPGSSNQIMRVPPYRPWSIVSDYPLESIVIFGLGFAASRIILGSKFN